MSVLDRTHRFNQRERDAWVAVFAGTVPASSCVLDVGAGRAPYRSLFAHCDYRTQDFGQEPSTLGSYAPLDYVSDITSIPVPDASFDVILCTEVLEHVPDPVAAIHEFARIVKPGGRVALTAPLGSFLHQEPYHYYGGYTPHWYRRVLGQAGFQIDSLEPNGGFFSWFGQEALRVAALLRPRATRHLAWHVRARLTLLWLPSLPFLAMAFPGCAVWLDRLNLEHTATVGYHVIATRNC